MKTSHRRSKGSHPDLLRALAAIQPLDQRSMRAARARQENLTKPKGSLGRLEGWAVQVAGIRREAIPRSGPKRIILCAGDHGVTVEGVSAYPSAVTPMMVLNFLKGGAAINALARQAGAQVQVVDVGVAANLPKHKDLVQAKVAWGTRNIRKEAAMSREECDRALRIGLDMAQRAFKDGIGWVVLGEMGIGNTTSAAALLAGLLPCRVEEATGLGTGISRAQWSHKCRVIQDAIRLHRPTPRSPWEALRRLGGLEIAALTGVILGCARRRIPVVVDGFITSAAFLVAYRLAPRVKDYVFFSHLSKEAGHVKFFEALRVNPLLDLDLRLGEGTGGTLALGLLESALRAHSEMATFQEAKVPTKTSKKRRR